MSFFARGFMRQNIVAIAVGVLVAGAPLVAFNFWFSGVIDKQGRDEADMSARHAIVLAERRTGQAIKALDNLSAAGIVDCSARSLEALQQAAFETIPVKEFSILDGSGRTLCSNSQTSLAADRETTRRILSTETLAGERGYWLDMVTLPGGRRMVRLRRPAGPGPHEIAALIPAGLYLPNLTGYLFGQEVPGANKDIAETAPRTDSLYAAMQTQGHVTLAEFGRRPDRVSRDSYVGEHRSGQYGFKVVFVVPNKLISAGGARLKWFGLFGTGLALALIGVFASLISRRGPPNPVLEIERALAAGQFVPYYQPIVDITTGQLRGAEVLVRWKKPDGSLVLPGAFIPLAESSGLIRAMTFDLMRRVSDEAGKALGERPGLKVSFNFASRLFSDEAVVQDVYNIFAKSPIKLTQVVLEVTERDPIQNFAATRQIIAALQSLGIRIAIDDVGTGHSGLSYMLKLGVDIIKIDKMFVDSIGTDRNSTTIVETLVDLAHNMRMDVVAEGVENFEQVMHLREIGIRAAQGYVFAPPLPGSAFLKLVEAMDSLGETTVPENESAAA